MESDTIATSLTGLSQQQQLYITWAVILIKLIGEWLGAATNGGGLKKILMRVWLGNTVDKVIAEDYKQELK